MAVDLDKETLLEICILPLLITFINLYCLQLVLSAFSNIIIQVSIHDPHKFRSPEHGRAGGRRVDTCWLALSSYKKTNSKFC